MEVSLETFIRGWNINMCCDFPRFGVSSKSLILIFF